MQNSQYNVMHTTTNSWNNDVLKSELPVFVDFWAEWCGPCRMVGPAIEQLSQTMGDRIKVAKLNVDENQEIAMRYGVQSIPSLILFKAGKEVARTIGAAPKEKYQKFIEESLLKAWTSKESAVSKFFFSEILHEQRDIAEKHRIF